MSQTPALTALAREGIAHRVISFEAEGHAGDYGRAAAAALDQSPAQVFKTLMVELDDGRLAVAMVPVEGRLDLKAVARVFSVRKAKMAEPRQAERATGYVVGGISPLGQKRRLPSVIDASALDFDELYVSAGRRGLEVALSPGDLIAATAAKVAPIATG
ncbi:Cys-tRNA(Pro) deacylase [Halotalea alkalilenta]|uniref:Cys-tRNA(Pro) deacylase n=1 Tax=Halotalea alkalilenta TaxID=376489 RepID=UPI000486A65A|nr:Cys-tRNA(Pro) deacylase [Halotalea alkalilenta]